MVIQIMIESLFPSSKIHLIQFQDIYIRGMDNQGRENSADHRKQKKKKHHRSRSDSKKHKKEKDRGASRDRKKDKEKKKHKSDSRGRDQRKEQKNDDKRSDERKLDKEKEERREREREEARQREREREERREKERQAQRSKQREKEREKQRQKQKERDRKDKDRSKQREKQKKRDRSRSKKRDERQRSRDKKDKKRFDDRDRRGKDRAREDKYERWRKEANFRFDSPPKSDDSDMSDDPEKVDRLNKMKAEKELVSSKADRKLYLGNLPPNITSNQLMQMLNSALKKMQINCEEEGDSIVSAWISPDGVGHYAFVQFRTAHEATAGLALNGASLYGYQLKLGRPKQYIEYHKQLLSEFGSDGNIDTILRKVQAMGDLTEALKIEERLVYPPSRVVVLKHVVTVQQLAIDEEYNEIVEDVTEMAKRHGDVLRVVIPRPMEIDLEQVKKRVKGLGYIFIKYKTIEQAKYARKEFIKQMFSERSVSCGFFPEKKFDQGELDVIDKIIIDF